MTTALIIICIVLCVAVVVGVVGWLGWGIERDKTHRARIARYHLRRRARRSGRAV